MHPNICSQALWVNHDIFFFPPSKRMTHVNSFLLTKLLIFCWIKCFLMLKTSCCLTGVCWTSRFRATQPLPSMKNQRSCFGEIAYERMINLASSQDECCPHSRQCVWDRWRSGWKSARLNKDSRASDKNRDERQWQGDNVQEQRPWSCFVVVLGGHPATGSKLNS